MCHSINYLDSLGGFGGGGGGGFQLFFLSRPSSLFGDFCGGLCGGCGGCFCGRLFPDIFYPMLQYANIEISPNPISKQIAANQCDINEHIDEFPPIFSLFIVLPSTCEIAFL